MSFRVIDVSVHQSEIDWKASKDSGVEAVMIRSGYSTNGPDTKFVLHIRSALAVGMAVGIYHYSYAESVEEARQEGKYCAELIRDYKDYITFPVAYDIEETSMQAYGKEKTTQMALAFCDEIRKEGYQPMVYCNLNWANNFIDIPTLQKNGIKFWIAQYNTECGYTGTYSMWQYSSTTHLPGSDQNIDSSHCYEDFTGGKIDFKRNTLRGVAADINFTGIPDLDLAELQRNCGVTQNKIADQNFLNKLMQHEVALGDTGFFVDWIQNRLRKLWFYKGEQVTHVNAELQRAIDAFHEYYQLPLGKISGIDWYYLIQP